MPSFLARPKPWEGIPGYKSHPRARVMSSVARSAIGRRRHFARKRHVRGLLRHRNLVGRQLRQIGWGIGLGISVGEAGSNGSGLSGDGRSGCGSRGPAALARIEPWPWVCDGNGAIILASLFERSAQDNPDLGIAGVGDHGGPYAAMILRSISELRERLRLLR
ncbi:hypothetical protein C5L14_14200 [Labrys okinawensis]|uniref:Uncharacterized protein n=1 Tax=Labrys okinawensis TaxID=346911 RepID=A0A2S9QAZ8_9HYPH|nr:hypothetical protein C5L14_14200 [Labrys okinawensis]